jgi:hypothetical protein
MYSYTINGYNGNIGNNASTRCGCHMQSYRMRTTAHMSTALPIPRGSHSEINYSIGASIDYVCMLIHGEWHICFNHICVFIPHECSVESIMHACSFDVSGALKSVMCACSPDMRTTLKSIIQSIQPSEPSNNSNLIMYACVSGMHAHSR